MNISKKYTRGKLATLSNYKLSLRDKTTGEETLVDVKEFAGLLIQLSAAEHERKDRRRSESK